MTKIIKALAMLCGSFWLAWVAYVNISSRDNLEGFSEKVEGMTAKAQERHRQMMQEERLAEEGWGSPAAAKVSHGGGPEDYDRRSSREESDWGMPAE